MTFGPIFGHEAQRAALAHAVHTNRLAQVLLITGPDGVGKQRLGIWLAQLLLCKAPNDNGPCGTCSGCLQVSGLSHPDFHWFVPTPRPKAGDPDKQVEEVREAQAEIMAARRENPVYGPLEGNAIHGVAMARLILRTVQLTSAAGGRRVLLIGSAERLVPQEGNPEAANALLKLLEEPSASTHILLTTSDAAQMLPTVKSRSVTIRLAPLPTAQVEAALEGLAPTLTTAERRKRAARANGSIGKALTTVTETSSLAQTDEFFQAAKQGGVARFQRCLMQAPWPGKGEFPELLEQLEFSLSAAVKARTTGQRDSGFPPILDSVDSPMRLITAIDRIEAVRDLALGNVNPQLLMATLTAELREVLWG